MADYIPFLIILMILAAIFREDSVLLVFYLIGGVYFFNQWWNRKIIKSITYKRTYVNRVFLGEKVPVRLEIHNPKSLPSLWLLVHESLPLDLLTPNFVRRVIHLQPHGDAAIDYSLNARKRGYYSVGPVFLRSGDFFGLSGEIERQGEVDPLIVYPQIVPIGISKLPSHSPYGTLKHNQPIFEDPARVGGKRGYQPGDSLRRMDWKATASTGMLTIKQFQPSIALETCIFLDLYALNYEAHTRINTTELGIVTAASLANWIIAQKQSMGFVTNGRDPFAENQKRHRIHAQKGRPQLMRVLDLLARIKLGESDSLVELLQHEVPYLPWGTTAIIITGILDDRIFDELFQARRRGLDVFILLIGPAPNRNRMLVQAEHFGFPIQTITCTADLEAWR